MIGPLLVIVLLLRAWTGHGREIPCEAQTCTAPAAYAQAKEDPAPVAVEMGERPQLAAVEIAPEKRPLAPIGARSASRRASAGAQEVKNTVPADQNGEK